MQKIYSPEELNSFSKETLVAVILSMQDQLTQLNTNMERLIEQIASANNHRYGRSSEKLDVIAGQLELELIFNEAEALTETLYVVAASPPPRPPVAPSFPTRPSCDLSSRLRSPPRRRAPECGGLLHQRHEPAQHRLRLHGQRLGRSRLHRGRDGRLR